MVAASIQPLAFDRPETSLAADRRMVSSHGVLMDAMDASLRALGSEHRLDEVVMGGAAERAPGCKDRLGTYV